MNQLKKIEVTELTAEEAAAMTGGRPIPNYVKCITTTLTRGEGSVRTLLLGFGLLGTARMVGVAAGCANF